MKAEENLFSLSEEQKVMARAHQETAEPPQTFQLDGGLALPDSEPLVFMSLPPQPQLEKVTVSGTGVEIGRETAADAAGVTTSGFNIRKVSPGSVLGAVNAPEKAAFFAQDIQRQSLDPTQNFAPADLPRHRLLR